MRNVGINAIDPEMILIENLNAAVNAGYARLRAGEITQHDMDEYRDVLHHNYATQVKRLRAMKAGLDESLINELTEQKQ